MLLPLLYFEATEAVLLYLVSGVALKVETSRWLSSGKLVAPKEDNIQESMLDGKAAAQMPKEGVKVNMVVPCNHAV